MFNTFNLFKTILSTSNATSSPCLFRSQLKPLLIYFKINANYLQKPIIILTINSIKKKYVLNIGYSYCTTYDKGPISPGPNLNGPKNSSRL